MWALRKRIESRSAIAGVPWRRVRLPKTPRHVEYWVSNRTRKMVPNDEVRLADNFLSSPQKWCSTYTRSPLRTRILWAHIYTIKRTPATKMAYFCPPDHVCEVRTCALAPVCGSGRNHPERTYTSVRYVTLQHSILFCVYSSLSR